MPAHFPIDVKLMASPGSELDKLKHLRAWKIFNHPYLQDPHILYGLKEKEEHASSEIL
jgi:hypothetical protein